MKERVKERGKKEEEKRRKKRGKARKKERKKERQTEIKKDRKKKRKRNRGNQRQKLACGGGRWRKRTRDRESQGAMNMIDPYIDPLGNKCRPAARWLDG